MFYAIGCDILDDRRRLQVAKVLKDFGVRVQLSVFEAELTPEELARLKRRVARHLNLEEDSLRLYPRCAACVPRIDILGQGVVTQDQGVVTQDPEVIIL